jgi:Zn-dependent peptidase ImmA (M78 family)
MSVRYARNEAAQVLQRCRQSSAPVDVEGVARQLGLQVVEKPLGGASGLLITGEGRALICVNSVGETRQRQRFTIAHEIGHFVLRHQFEKGEHVHVDRGNFISARNARASAGVDLKEIEANQFAAALLMPVGLVEAEASKLVGDGPLLDQHVALLATKFDVSEQAMTIRLSSLGVGGL